MSKHSRSNITFSLSIKSWNSGSFIRHLGSEYSFFKLSKPQMLPGLTRLNLQIMFPILLILESLMQLSSWQTVSDSESWASYLKVSPCELCGHRKSSIWHSSRSEISRLSLICSSIFLCTCLLCSASTTGASSRLRASSWSSGLGKGLFFCASSSSLTCAYCSSVIGFRRTNTSASSFSIILTLLCPSLLEILKTRGFSEISTTPAMSWLVCAVPDFIA
jgi:hypothetical protein